MTSADEIMLETQGLNRRFGALEVARDISIALPRGCRYALIGPNGAGKTTFINLVTGRLKPDAGRIRLAGSDITDEPPHRRVRAGLARTFQINTLFPELTPLEAVTLAVCERERIAGEFWRPLSKQKHAIEESFRILEQLKLADVATRMTSTLAYGQQRLLEIALALAARPKVLLLDEPAAGVPKDESAMLFAVISALPEHISVLFIEHDMNLVFRFATRIIVMVGGGVLVEDEPHVIRTDPRVRDVYLGHSLHG